MTATPRELVHQTLSFASPARLPRDLWTLPIAQRVFETWARLGAGEGARTETVRGQQ
jgi:hypothetical protein